jgi:hypothetical protein
MFLPWNVFYWKRGSRATEPVLREQIAREWRRSFEVWGYAL